jgi:hypothetical protein
VPEALVPAALDADKIIEHKKVRLFGKNRSYSKKKK